MKSARWLSLAAVIVIVGGQALQAETRRVAISPGSPNDCCATILVEMVDNGSSCKSRWYSGDNQGNYCSINDWTNGCPLWSTVPEGGLWAI